MAVFTEPESFEATATENGKVSVKTLNADGFNYWYSLTPEAARQLAQELSDAADAAEED